MTDRGWKIFGISLAIVSTVVAGVIIIRRMTRTKPFVYDANASTDQRIKNYLEWITPVAKKLGRKHGLPYQALVVQTALETGWGKSKLASEGFNFAGIKAVGNQPYIEAKTHEYRNGVRTEETARFRKFSTLEQGLEEYALIFHKNRYAEALKYPNDPYQFIVEIKKAGYATSLDYISKLHGMLDLKNFCKHIPFY
jgi:flagellum-specific peptidoglycan hydrolase FlgJ